MKVLASHKYGRLVKKGRRSYWVQAPEVIRSGWMDRCGPMHTRRWAWRVWYQQAKGPWSA